jgi:hypothetical protein
MRKYLLVLLIPLFVALYGFHEWSKPHAANAAVTEAVSASTPCVNATAPAKFSHIIVWELENHSYSATRGVMPYLDGIADQCGYWDSTSFLANHHPSLPNYLHQTYGSNWGVTDDGTPAQHPENLENIFHQLGAGAKSYMEGMPNNCTLANSGKYTAHHNPAAYYTYLNSRTLCQTNDVPYTQFATALATESTFPKFAFVVPTNCHNGHPNSCSGTKVTDLKALAIQADNFLKTELPKILNSPTYTSGKTLVLITWDEGKKYSGAAGNAQNIYTVAVAPNLNGGVFHVSPANDENSELQFIEKEFGVSVLAPSGTGTTFPAGLHQ